MLLSVIYSLGICQAIILAIFLFKSRYTLWQGNTYLSLFLVCIACILGIFLARIHLGLKIPALIFWPVVSLPALFGPLLFSYIKSLENKNNHSSQTHDYLHYTPFLGLLCLFMPEILTLPSEGITHLDDQIVRIKIAIASYIKSITIISYLAVSLRKIYNNSFIDSVSPSSLRMLKIIFTLFLIVAIIGIIFTTLFWTGLYISLWADYLELVFLTLLSYIFSLYVLQSHLTPLHPKTPYHKTNLPVSTRRQLSDELKALMEKDKIFTQEEYSAKYVSQKLGITEQNLSEVLALSFDSNFYEYSNKYRIALFKDLLIKNLDQKLLDLAMEAGFTSKSSFNRAVKSATGMTPTELRSTLISA